MVTVPVAAVAYVQWGIGSEFYTVTIAYLILQILDGNVLVPVIFLKQMTCIRLRSSRRFWSLVVSGAGRVFFAIPLATLVKAIMNAWPSRVQAKMPDVNE